MTEARGLLDPREPGRLGDPHRRGAGNARVHVPRAGAGRAGRRAERHLRPGHHPPASCSPGSGPSAPGPSSRAATPSSTTSRRRSRPRFPTGVAQVVQRCLSKDPEQRFQSARDVGFSLEALRGTGATTPAQAAAASRAEVAARALRLARWLAPALLLRLAAYVAGRAARSPAPQPRIRQLTFHRGAVFSSRFAPDGKTVHFSAAWNDAVPELFTTGADSRAFRSLGVGKAELLSVSGAGKLAVLLNPTLSPRVRAHGHLAVVPALGAARASSPPTCSTRTGRRTAGRWRWSGAGAEGTTLEFPLGTVVFRSTGFVSDPRVSATGNRVAFLDHPRAGDSAARVMVVGKDGRAEAWSSLFDDGFGVAWSRSGDEVLAALAQPGDLASLWAVRKGSAPRLVHRGTGNLTIDDVDRDGRMLVETAGLGSGAGRLPAGRAATFHRVARLGQRERHLGRRQEILSFESGVGASRTSWSCFATWSSGRPSSWESVEALRSPRTGAGRWSASGRRGAISTASSPPARASHGTSWSPGWSGSIPRASFATGNGSRFTEGAART